MKIYTKTGDKGTTSLIYGQRVSKTDIRVEAYGTCDEANSAIGLGISHLKDEEFSGKEDILKTFHFIQTALFHVGAELATPAGKKVNWKLEKGHVDQLEGAIDQMENELTPLSNFILPGGHPAGAALHLARTISRRAERNAVEIGEGVNPMVLSYLNRLSDFLFVAARYVNYKLNQPELNLHEE
ncbi:cob(I)yrinic acid a,c-diamide adenosyltransferase [Peribacillus deserti]|uniref:Corrinoid adenosyltransferase n=1 Tax=Peribacillus deserti TaxID=673318 RepID=A0A2N5MBX3_9BACI|nr:cob(I)yrinic acid a,c-diamide adenosyltransferase [Peribacillus deserti]PLT31854.1 ATP:cob(I)alamin adenosyltransferase [Peribacillus deserti]